MRANLGSVFGWIVPLVSALLLSAADGVSAAPQPTCTVTEEAGVSISEATIRLRRKPLVVAVQRRTIDPAGTTITSATLLKRGDQVVFEAYTAVAPDGSVTGIQRFGRGFKGITELQIRFDDGKAEMVVDDRLVTVQGVGTPDLALTFVDGQPPPRLKAKRKVGRFLRKLEKLGRITCPAAAQAQPLDELNDPFETPCSSCHFGCFLKGEACFAGKVVACAITPAGCALAVVIEFFESSLSCGDALVQCSDACNAKGAACCTSFCGNFCCGGARDAREDWACAGANAQNPGTCCLPEDVCGGKCCFGEGTSCVDAQRSLCCRAGEKGCKDNCCPASSKCDPNVGICCAGDPCGQFCCPAGQRCRTPSDDFDEVDCIACAAEQSGPVCGGTCCGANEVCGFGNECCTSDQLCGGSCCTPGNCINGTICCDLPDVRCGATCCPGLTTECCNGQCCPGTCIGGAICCPKERACGTTCCAPGSACANPNTGTCQACPAGQEPCAFSPGSPLCCPGGAECCGNGQCCSGATPMCCDFGEGPVCAITCLR